MTKKEKAASIFLMVSMVAVIISATCTIIHNKPAGYSFNIEKWYMDLK